VKEFHQAAENCHFPRGPSHGIQGACNLRARLWSLQAVAASAAAWRSAFQAASKDLGNSNAFHVGIRECSRPATQLI